MLNEDNEAFNELVKKSNEVNGKILNRVFDEGYSAGALPLQTEIDNLQKENAKMKEKIRKFVEQMNAALQE